jgi:hypothetical protein
VAIALLAVLAAGCRRPPEQADLSRFLRAGVDVADEADAVVRSLEGAGHGLEARVDTPELAALAFERGDGATAVRVVTGRGIAFGLDGDPMGLQPRTPHRVELVKPELGGRDLDGDGRPELLLGVSRRGASSPCVAVLRVAEGGFVVEVPLDMGATVGDACVEDVGHVGGGDIPELLVVERHGDLLTPDPPTAVLPLTGDQGRWGPALGAAYRAFWDGERKRREEDTGAAPPDGHAAVLRTVRLATELAAIARLTEAGLADQIRAFDDALRGTVLTPGSASVVDCVRGHILAGWPQPASPCYTPEAHGP